MQNKFGKLPLLTSGALLVFILLFVPLFTIVGAVTAPFHMVSDMIRNIGDFLVPDDSYTNDVFVVIDQYFEYGEGYELLASDYKHIIVDHEDLIYVPDNYLLIPNILIKKDRADRRNPRYGHCQQGEPGLKETDQTDCTGASSAGKSGIRLFPV